MFVRMTIYEAKQELLFRLQALYESREAGNITDLVMEHITGLNKINRIINKQLPLSGPMEEKLQQHTAALLKGRPVQYVLQESWFQGMKFFVNESVLIPRPETEELVEWAVNEVKEQNMLLNAQIIDVGTGSGCIAISMKKKLPAAKVFACDISATALAVAEKNAVSNNVFITQVLVDFLNPEEQKKIPFVDVIVSNPPYIPYREKNELPANVRSFEPSIALFVHDDPLVFYRAIVLCAKNKLKAGGLIFVEVHEQYAPAVKNLFLQAACIDVVMKKDLQGKDRMIKCRIDK